MHSDDLALFADLDPVTSAVRDLGRVSRQLTGELARSLGMGANDMEALGVLVRHDGLGAADLAERLGIRSASATGLIDRLEQAGHVERRRDTADRRRITVVPTPTARQATSETWGPVIQSIDAVSAALSEEDRATVAEFLTEVSKAIGAHLRTPASPQEPPVS
ncbi:MarR family winged helix-turn-helix transcriptional regulator [Lentzea sp. NPDC060358]|uniref:MarR family winged helix-turn-helix transcriptional regulator n=1 Tax=Lentzea sp. NPDC060358 TaxID=3347103 RepID=UPI00364A5C5F